MKEFPEFPRKAEIMQQVIHQQESREQRIVEAFIITAILTVILFVTISFIDYDFLANMNVKSKIFLIIIAFIIIYFVIYYSPIIDFLRKSFSCQHDYIITDIKTEGLRKGTMIVTIKCKNCDSGMQTFHDLTETERLEFRGLGIEELLIKQGYIIKKKGKLYFHKPKFNH